MRHLTIARRLGVPAAVAVLGALVATPALAADVTVSPATAEQGSGENLTFHLVNTGTQPLGRITLRLPADTPVAEVYPLSVDDWAPKIEMRTLATPLATIHGGTPATETASAITWLAMPGRTLAPGAATDVAVAIGPLPTLSSMRFTLATTYVDGKPGPTMPAALTLTPAAAGAAPAAGHHGGGTVPATGDELSPAEQDALQQALADADRGPSFWSIAGWVVAALALLGGAVVLLRGRHRATEEDDEPQDEEPSAAKDEQLDDEKEPVAAGSSKWSFHG
ncbi:MAG: DUF1775 domain-containing protein [Actinoplanes sp.]